MSIRHHNWLSLQATRRYPLADTATGTADDGQRLRDDIITDLHIRWPRTLGQYAFLGGLTVTPNIVTAVIMAASAQAGDAGLVPLASVTLPQPVTVSRLYALTPLQKGVGGFIAFGDVGESVALRFSSPTQSLLLPRVARPYAPLPIPYFKKEGLADGLSGVVRLLAGTGLEVVRETVPIEGQNVEAVVIRLPASTLTDNSLAEYIGPCGIRPESGNCPAPGLETIAGVGPDCDGNINISFLNFVTAPYPCDDGYAGITLDQNIGLSAVCVQDTLFPFAGEDFCLPQESEESSLSSAGPPDDSSSDTPPGSSEDSSDSSAMIPCEDLPFLECFDAPWSDRWVVDSGSFHPVTITPQGDCQEYSSMSSSATLLPGTGAQAADSSKRNVMVWEDCGVGSSLNKRASVRVQLTHQSFAQNAGLVLNHRIENPLLSSQPDYLIVGIDRSANRFMLQRYSGGAFIVEHSVAPATTFNVDDWYEITATAVPSGPNVLVQCLVQNITQPLWPSLSFLVTTARWGSPVGFFGIHTMQSVARFAAWRLEDV